MTCIPLVLLCAACVSILATASRQTFAFARDDGLPMSHVFRRVYKLGTEIPLNSVILSLSITVLLAIINIASTAAFNSVVSLLISSLFTGYFISISCILIKRLRGEPLPPSRWGMGRWTIPVNIIALAYILFAFIMSFFPIFNHPEPINMNWSVVVWSAIMIFAIVVYGISGRKKYRGPVVYVRKDFEVDPAMMHNE
jgi:amino acid transporter